MTEDRSMPTSETLKAFGVTMKQACERGARSGRRLNHAFLHMGPKAKPSPSTCDYCAGVEEF